MTHFFGNQKDYHWNLRQINKTWPRFVFPTEVCRVLIFSKNLNKKWNTDRRGYRNSIGGIRDFEKGKILQKRETRETFYKNYLFKIRPGFYVFDGFSLILNWHFSQKRKKFGFFFCSGGCVATPERVRGMRPPTRIPPVSASEHRHAVIGRKQG